MPAIGFLPIARKIIAPRGGITTNPVPPAASAITQANVKIIMIFKSAPLERSVKPRRLAEKRPELSHTPTPSMHIRTIPRADSPVKLLTAVVSILMKPSLDAKLKTVIVFFVAGLMPEKPIEESNQEKRIVAMLR